MIDWGAVQEEVTEHLRALLRIDTTNPPGNESAAARYLEGVLKQEGFAPVFSESAPGRGNVTARLEGGGAGALLLLSHTDVVAAEPEKWTHPPFSGALEGGYVWGRGALDMKNMVAAELMVLLLLKREGVALDRPVLFAATADEEAGRGEHGVAWLLDNHPEQVDAPYIITEGGGHDIRVGGQRYYACQTGQKGICRMRLRARGRPGHGSMPPSESAVLSLCRAVGALQGVELPVHPAATLRAFVEGLASRQEEKVAQRLRDLLDGEKSAQALRELPLDAGLREEVRAVLRNTAAVSMLRAGTKINVIPAEATAFVDGRLAPGQTPESFVEELRPYIGQDLEVEVDQYSPPREGRMDTELFRTIVEVMAERDPEAPVVPYLDPAGTDAKHICPRRPQTQIYGFMPYRQDPAINEMKLMHGHDERTSVEELLFAVQVLYAIACRFGGLRSGD